MPLTAKTPSQYLVDLVGTLGGTWSGNRAMCRCPAHADGTPSLSLRQGDRGVLVHCFAGCESADVLRELKSIVPGRRYDFLPKPERSFNSSELARRIWSQGVPIAGTWGAAYAGFRGIVGSYDDLRFHPRCPRGKKPHTVFLPALLVGVRQAREIMAVQRIFLKPGGQGYTAKVMIGNPQQASWQGQRPCKVLAIAEGFETAARFADLHDIPTWASLGAGRLTQLRLPDGITELIIAEDNDDEGRKASLKAIEAYAREGLEIRRMPPPSRFKDWARVTGAQ